MEQLTQKLGPLPLWAWAAIGLLAILGYMYFTKTGFFGNASGTAADSGTGLNGLLGNLGLNPNNYASSGGGGSGSNPIGPTITYYEATSNPSPSPNRGSTTGGGFYEATSNPNPTLANLSTLAPGTVLTAPNTGQPLSIMGFWNQPLTPAAYSPGYVQKTSGSILQRTFATPAPTPVPSQGRFGGALP